MRTLWPLFLLACGAPAAAPPARAAPSVEAPVAVASVPAAVPEAGGDPRYDGPPLVRSPSAFPEAPRFRARAFPSGTPAILAETAALLFRLGMPDPAGLPLHAVTLRTGSVWGGDAGPVETVGWLLPGPAVDGRRFVIAPNGLIYAAASDLLRAQTEMVLWGLRSIPTGMPWRQARGAGDRARAGRGRRQPRALRHSPAVRARARRGATRAVTRAHRRSANALYLPVVE